MVYEVKNNMLFTHSFEEVFPCGHSNNSPAMAQRIFQSRAEGSRIWDIDDNEYIDYTGALGPNILGHCHPKLTAGLKAYLDQKSVCTGASFLFSEDDVHLGRKIIKHVPCAEQVKLCVTGSEAVQQALRLARAYTQRPYYLKFGGHYHGWIDSIFGGEPNPEKDVKPFPVFDKRTNTKGKSPGSYAEGLMVPWGDLEKLKDTLESYGSDIAVMIMEPVCNGGTLLPVEGLLEEIRQLCNHYGVLLCFDEVITGFRTSLGGAQQTFGVVPDLCTLGKALGGGMPISAVAGRADILNQFRDAAVMGQGTFNGNPFCVKSALETISILEQDNGAAFSHMEHVQRELMIGLDRVARDKGIPMRVQGPTGVFATFFGADPDKPLQYSVDLETVDHQLMLKFHKSSLEKGVYTLFGRWFPSVVHTQKDTVQALEVFEDVLSGL